ncbi:MAG: 2,3,4,5-tetrahydropyridine-2,6-dicarboxylate N-succinyltransferase, partial [Terriglobales bacterium]
MREEIERLYELKGDAKSDPARILFAEFRDALTAGRIRAAEKVAGEWRVNAWVKKGILLGFRLGELEETGE